jgi:hypothetical protein
MVNIPITYVTMDIPCPHPECGQISKQLVSKLVAALDRTVPCTYCGRSINLESHRAAILQTAKTLREIKPTLPT